MRPLMHLAWLFTPALLVAAGCGQAPFAVNQQVRSLQTQVNGQLAQLQELHRRAAQLDADNRDLHAQLAQSEQQVQVYGDEVKLLRTQLGETAGKLAESKSALKKAEERIEAITASTRHHGGATITANNSRRRALAAIAIDGVNVREDNGAIRIEMPADSLFLRGTATLHRDGFSLLDRVVDAIMRSYPGQPIAVEGHTDNAPIYGAQWRNHHQLAAAQAMAVFEQLTSRYRISAARVRVVSFGASRPLVSNGPAEGQARNRRIELVVYPADEDV